MGGDVLEHFPTHHSVEQSAVERQIDRTANHEGSAAVRNVAARSVEVALADLDAGNAHRSAVESDKLEPAESTADVEDIAPG